MTYCKCCGANLSEIGMTDKIFSDLGLWGCPQCGREDEFIEREECQFCHEEFDLDDLNSNICESCLREQVTPELFKEFCEDQEWILDDFMWSAHFGFSGDAKSELSDFLHTEFDKQYAAADDKLTDYIIKYFSDDYAWFIDWRYKNAS